MPYYCFLCNDRHDDLPTEEHFIPRSIGDQNINGYQFANQVTLGPILCLIMMQGIFFTGKVQKH